MGRRELREHIFRILFRHDFFPPEELGEQAELYIENLKEPEPKDTAYILDKSSKIMEMTEMLDEIINENTTGWNTRRMGKVDLTILRLAVYEIRYDDDIPASVAINEAVELAKRYGGDSTPAFVNGVLAKLV